MLSRGNVDVTTGRHIETSAMRCQVTLESKHGQDSERVKSCRHSQGVFDISNLPAIAEQVDAGARGQVLSDTRECEKQRRSGFLDPQ